MKSNSLEGKKSEDSVEPNFIFSASDPSPFNSRSAFVIAYVSGLIS